MGIEVAIVAGIIAGTGAGVASGIEARKSAKKAARIEERNTQLQAGFLEEETEKLKKRQKLLFLKSGINLEGSPLLLLKETERIGAKRSAEIRAFGAERARGLRRAGKSALTSNIFSGFTSGVSLAAATSLLVPAAAPAAAATALI